jgi:hypothetical protein
MDNIKTEKLYNDTIELTFNEKNHQFKVNGKPVKSVTYFTGVIDASGPLMYWAVNQAKLFLQDLLNQGKPITSVSIEEAGKQHRIKKEAAGTIGTNVHDWIERYIKGENPEMPEVAEELNGILAFLKWLEEHQVEFIESEKLIYSKEYNYTGILDAIAKIDGKTCLIDFKTSKGVYEGYFLQIAAYRNAYEEMTGKKLDGFNKIVHVNKETGEFKLIEAIDHERDFEAFAATITLRRRMEELKEVM